MTNSKIIILIALIASFQIVGTVKATILPIQNPSMEKGNAGKPSNWSWWSRTQEGAATWTNSDFHGGKYCVCIQHDGPRDWAFSNKTKIKVVPGDALKVSAWVKVKTGHVELAVVAMEKDDVLSWNIGSISTLSNTKWEYIEAIAEIPKDCDNVYVRFTGSKATLAWVDDVQLETYDLKRNTINKLKVTGFAKKRVVEKMDRSVVVKPLDNGNIYIGWRLLASDPKNVTFNIYRQMDGEEPEKLNMLPISETTDFVDIKPPRDKTISYYVCPMTKGLEGDKSRTIDLHNTTHYSPYISIKLQDKHSFSKVGIADLDGDGRYDYIIKQPGGNIDPYEKYWKKSDSTLKLEAYNADGKFMWRHDLGWAIEAGIWYSPYVVYDFNGDGKAEVAVKTGKGDPRDKDGRVQSGSEYLTILNGTTGKQIAQTDWPSRSLFALTSSPYNYSSRNQLGIAYLDGKTPCLIVERGTYNVIVVVAYELKGNTLRKLWKWDNRNLLRSYYGQGAHWMHGVDVDDDGRDEIVIGSAVIDDNGDSLWTTGLGHPDHTYVGDLDPSRPGLEIYYGIESQQKKANGMCMVDAETGKILWGYKGFTRHVHSCGMCSDIDAKHLGTECYSTDSNEEKKTAWAHLQTSRGKVISDQLSWGFGPKSVYWNADIQREILWKNQIQDYDNEINYDPKIDGHIIAIADVIGDWREEIIVAVEGEIRIYTTTIPALDRRPCLMTDPVYRIDVAHAAMGYTQVPMLSYDISSQTNKFQNNIIK